jgi:hypothetical protein
MSRETMTRAERVDAAVRLEKPDRVPVVPLLCAEAAGTLSGATMAQVSNDSQILFNSMLKVFDDYGGWDAMHGGVWRPIHVQATGTHPMKIRIPGVDLPDDYVFQLAEEPIMQLDDYDKICEMGFDDFYYDDYLWRISSLTPDSLSDALEDLMVWGMKFLPEMERRGVGMWVAATGMHPFFHLSLMRSLVNFTEDLYYRPEIVEKTLKRLTADLIPKQIAMAKQLGHTRWLLTEERASAYTYPLSIFERFWWPYTQEIVEAFWSEGIVTVFHIDTPWDKNLPYFKRLPKGSYVVSLDSTTDIFAAKHLLRGHGAIYGDISASLLTIGSPADVEAYVKRLIDEVGNDGGFILGQGCNLPPNLKPENFRAMLETCKNYEFSKK